MSVQCFVHAVWSLELSCFKFTVESGDKRIVKYMTQEEFQQKIKDLAAIASSSNAGVSVKFEGDNNESFDVDMDVSYLKRVIEYLELVYSMWEDYYQYKAK